MLVAAALREASRAPIHVRTAHPAHRDSPCSSVRRTIATASDPTDLRTAPRRRRPRPARRPGSQTLTGRDCGVYHRSPRRARSAGAAERQIDQPATPPSSSTNPSPVFRGSPTSNASSSPPPFWNVTTRATTSIAPALTTCTATPDGDPLVGEIRSGLFVATGFHGHGFMRAPALGERIADEILGDDGVRRFDPTRFDGSETFAVVAGMDIE